jgi:hypothetical protein
MLQQPTQPKNYVITGLDIMGQPVSKRVVAVSALKARQRATSLCWKKIIVREERILS